MSIRAYLHRVRLGNALQRVADGERSLATIALDAGFCSHSHFTTTCTRILGAPSDTVRTPAELRRAG